MGKIFNEDIKQKCCELYLTNSATKVATILNIGRTSVYNILRSHNIICKKNSGHCIKCGAPKISNARCKQCMTLNNKNKYIKNKKNILENQKIYYIKNKDKISLKNKQWKIKNKHKFSLLEKNYYIKNKEKLDNYKKKWIKNNLERYRAQRRKYNNNLSIKLRKTISSSITRALKKKTTSKCEASCLKYLQYSIKELKTHIESQFELWMSWENWGPYSPKTWDDNDSSTWVWNIDHIIPQSKLLYTSMEDENFKICWSLKNLRPYSAKQNIIDNNKRKL